MENQSPSSLANSALSRRSDASDERDLEIAKLKERLGFYESFDQIIQENVARAGDLLRHAVSVRENADEAVSSATKELEQKRLSERQEQRALLSGLLDDVTTMQVHVERLARKVADAIDDIEATLPAGPDLDFLPASSAAPVAALVAPAVGSHSDQVLDPTPDEIAPDDLATIAARVAEAHSPLEVETAAVAAETLEVDDVLSSSFRSTENETDFAEGTLGESPSEEPPLSFDDSIDVSTDDVAMESGSETEDVSISNAVKAFEPDTSADNTDVDDRADFLASESIEHIEKEIPPSLAESVGDENSADFLPELESNAVEEAGLSSSSSEEMEVLDSIDAETPEVEDLPESISSFEDEPAAIDTLDVESAVLVTSFDSTRAAPELAQVEFHAESAASTESEGSSFEESSGDRAYFASLPGSLRSRLTDELFLAPERSPTDVKVDLDGETSLETVNEDDMAVSVADSAEPVSAEKTESALGDDGVLTADASTNDVVDAEAVSDAMELSVSQSAPPAALAEDPMIDAALTESVQHVADEPGESELNVVEPVENSESFETVEIITESAIPVVQEAPAAVPDVRPFPAGGLGTAPRPSTAELRNAALARFTAPSAPTGVRGIGTAVLVHGVPRATTALSLKRYLESLPHVSSVEPREYAEGILRLHVTADRSIHIDDLRGWSDGMGFEPVHLRDDLVEVRLPH